MSITTKDLYFLNIATDAASENLTSNYKLGACLQIRKKFYYSASQNTRSKVNSYSLSSIHAEMAVLWKSKKYRKVHKHACMYVVRVSPSGALRNAKPCAHCVLLLKHANVKFCCWSTGNDDAPFVKLAVKHVKQEHLSFSQKKWQKDQSHKGIPLF